MRDQVLSHVDSYPFAPTSSLSSKFFLPPFEWKKSIPPRVLLSFSFRKKESNRNWKTNEKERKKKKIREHISKLFFQNNVIYIVIAPAKTGNDIIDKIAVIKTDHGNSEIWS